MPHNYTHHQWFHAGHPYAIKCRRCGRVQYTQILLNSTTAIAQVIEAYRTNTGCDEELVAKVAARLRGLYHKVTYFDD